MQISNEILLDIVGNLETGLKSYIHKETLEVVAVPDPDQYTGMDLEGWQDDIKKVKKNKRKFVEIESMASFESYKIMEDFVESIEDKNVRGRLLQAIGGRKPFANFKIQIDHSGPYREAWFKFRSERLMEWVKSQLEHVK